MGAAEDKDSIPITATETVTINFIWYLLLKYVIQIMKLRECGDSAQRIICLIR